MHLMYYLDANGKRAYTLKEEFGEDEAHRTEVGFGCLVGTCWGDVEKYHGKENPAGKVTESAHPARFSPDDKFSGQRVACKKRFGIYLPDHPQKPM